MYTCIGALVHSRALGKASGLAGSALLFAPCLEAPVLESGVRSKHQPAARRPTSALSPRPTCSAQRLLSTTVHYCTGPEDLQGHTGPKLFQPWLAIDASGCHVRVTALTARSSQLQQSHTDRGDLLQRNALLAWQAGRAGQDGRVRHQHSRPHPHSHPGQTGRRDRARFACRAYLLVARFRSMVPHLTISVSSQGSRRVAANAKLSRPLGFGTGTAIIDIGPSSTVRLPNPATATAHAILARILRSRRLRCHSRRAPSGRRSNPAASWGLSCALVWCVEGLSIIVPSFSSSSSSSSWSLPISVFRSLFP